MSRSTDALMSRAESLAHASQAVTVVANGPVAWSSAWMGEPLAAAFYPLRGEETPACRAFPGGAHR